MCLPYKGKAPEIAKDVFVAPSASVVGDVKDHDVKDEGANLVR